MVEIQNYINDIQLGSLSDCSFFNFKQLMCVLLNSVFKVHYSYCFNGTNYMMHALGYYRWSSCFGQLKLALPGPEELAQGWQHNF